MKNEDVLRAGHPTCPSAVSSSVTNLPSSVISAASVALAGRSSAFSSSSADISWTSTNPRVESFSRALCRVP